MGEGKTTPLDRRRLSQLLALIGSSHEGEALSAARAADRMVKAADVSWSEVVHSPSAGSEPAGQSAAAGGHQAAPANPPAPGNHAATPDDEARRRMQEIEIVLKLTQSRKIPAGLRLSIERMLPAICKGVLSAGDRRYLGQLYRDVIVEGRSFR